MRTHGSFLVLLAAVAATLAAAPGGAGTALEAPTDAVSAPTDAITATTCDRLDPALCLLPFPNDLFTVPDERTATGRRVAFNLAAMPRNGTDHHWTAGRRGRRRHHRRRR